MRTPQIQPSGAVGLAFITPDVAATIAVGADCHRAAALVSLCSYAAPVWAARFNLAVP